MDIVIEETKAFKFDGIAYLTRDQAQAAALESLFATIDTDNGERHFSAEDAANAVICHKDEVIAILTGTKPRRKRSDAGKPHAKPAKIPTRIKDMPVDGGKFPENAGVTIEPLSKYKGK